MAAAGPAVAKSRAQTALVPAAATLPLAELAPLIAVVSVGDQRVTIWSGDTVVASAPVSTGMDGHRTPLGVFSVIGKERYHESNIYSGAPMPFMQRITWSGVAMHAGALPGYPASHGCIRLPESFAQRLYGMTRMGMRVIVASRDVSPSAVSNPALPAPTFVRAAQLASAAPAAAVGRMQLGGPDEPKDRLLNPMERGKMEQGRAKFAAQEAEADVQVLLQLAAEYSEDARVTLAAAQTAALARDTTRFGLEKARQVASDPANDAETRARGETSRLILEAAYAAAVQRSVTAKHRADEADAHAFRAAAEAKSAMAERDTLVQTARVAAKATEPLSVFVSRKEHRVFVRQGFEPVFDADVDIADAETPLGTHVFTAVGAPTEGGALRWVTMTIPGTGRADEPRGRPAKAVLISQPVSPAVSLPPTAANALARVKFSDAVLQKISEKLWTGASLIISDYGISDETGKGTDFVVLTR